jgi:hypothetical protein
LWRVIYNLLGYGVYGGDLYIDPANEPVHYIVALVERVPIVLIGQLSGQSCDLYHFLSNSIRQKLSLLSIAFLALVFITLIPLLRKNRIARFWFIAMILSILPIATVAPMSKNLPFVGFAAFGLVASFVGGLLAKENWVPKSRMWRVAGWTVCIVFLVVHLPMAAAGRIMAPRMTSFAFDAMDPAIDIGSSRELEKQDLVLVNAPCQLAITVMPFLRAYKGQPLPRTVRTLAPGFRTLEVHRTGDKTLVLKTLSGDIFSCEHKSPLHTAYFFETLNVFRAKRFPFSAGDKIILPPLTVEVINVDRDGKATDVLFSFAVPLEDESLNWVWFNWNDGRYCSFEVPAIGESVEIAGPPPVSLHGAMKYVMNTLFQR